MNLEGRRILSSVATPVVDLGGADVGVTEPGLDLGDVGFVLQGVGRCGGAGENGFSE